VHDHFVVLQGSHHQNHGQQSVRPEVGFQPWVLEAEVAPLVRAQRRGHRLPRYLYLGAVYDAHVRVVHLVELDLSQAIDLNVASLSLLVNHYILEHFVSEHKHEGFPNETRFLLAQQTLVDN